MTPSSSEGEADSVPQHSAELEALRRSAETLISGGDSGKAVDVLLDVISSLQSDNQRLVDRLVQSHRALYGRRSEKLTAEELGQLVLALGGSEAEAANAEPAVPSPARSVEVDDSSEVDKAKSPRRRRKRSKHKGRTQLDPGLPRVVSEVAVPADERAC
ncbi:MAG: hypothetical protein AAF605_09220, partial [Myxococcota bacterium]